MTPNLIATEFQKLDDQWSAFPTATTRSFVIGHHLINLEFAGPSLAPLLCDALAHLEIQTDQNQLLETRPDTTCDATSKQARNTAHIPALTIRAWDCEEKQFPIPSLRWDILHANGYHGVSKDGYSFQFFEGINAISFLSLEHKVAYYITKNHRELPWWVRGSPLQAIFSAFFRAQGLQLTHVAAVGNDDHCVLLAGKGGSGKTTTTLACLIQGMTYLGEDYCLLEPTPDATIIHSVYQSAKWTAQTRAMYPQFDTLVCNEPISEQDKSLIFYRDSFPDQVSAALPAKAIIALSIQAHTNPKLMASDAVTSLKQLTLSTVKQLPFFDRQTNTLLQQCCDRVRHYALKLGQDRDANVRVIQDILARETA